MAPRYAIYYAPPEDSALARAGAAWLGRDAGRDQPVPQPAVPGIDAAELAAVTSSPRRYGFHATLKPPFELARGRDEQMLSRAVAALAQRHRPIPVPRLAVSRLGGFLALTPAQPAPALVRLAGECVAELDAFRAPPDPAELERRRAAGLSPRQSELLEAWGYAYVMDEFRFHMTLTERIGAQDLAARLEAALHLHFSDLLERPLPVDALCIFAQERPDRPFRILARCPLSS